MVSGTLALPKTIVLAICPVECRGNPCVHPSVHPTIHPEPYDGWPTGRGGRMNGRTDGQMDGRTHRFPLYSSPLGPLPKKRHLSFLSLTNHSNGRPGEVRGLGEGKPGSNFPENY